MLAPLDSCHGRHRMEMVRRADDNRIDLIFHLIEHLAEITINPGLGILLNCRGTTQVNVA